MVFMWYIGYIEVVNGIITTTSPFITGGHHRTTLHGISMLSWFQTNLSSQKLPPSAGPGYDQGLVRLWDRYGSQGYVE